MKELKGFITIQINEEALVNDIDWIFKNMEILAGENGGNRVIVEKLYKAIDIALKIDDSIFPLLPQVTKTIVLYKTNIKLSMKDITDIALVLEFISPNIATVMLKPISMSNLALNLLDENGVRKRITSFKPGYIYADTYNKRWLYLGEDNFVRGNTLFGRFKGKDLEEIKKFYLQKSIKKTEIIIDELFKFSK